MPKKFYAVKYGIDPSTKNEVRDKIFESWDKCSLVVKKVKGAKYKSFSTEKEAIEFLELGDKLLKKGEDSFDENIFHAYVDGSYLNTTKEFSYGIVITLNGIVHYLDMGAFKSDEENNVRQVAGELMGAIKAIEFAKDNNINDIAIFHDYVGVAYHATGFWERKEPSSIEYYEKMNNLMKENYINVSFVKVDSHTGDKFNEIADELAKHAVGNKSTGELKKIIEKDGIDVVSEDLKLELEKVAGLKRSNKIKLVNSNFSADMNSAKAEKESTNGLIDLLKSSKKNEIKHILDTLEKNELTKIIIELLE
ncbi:viroplasmin family protein [Clostridium grantii]|uniref:ribonuclease H n=1 Tax=Clostridium grantii DSM 8605 TaxID=1121316 RepID=A0A1M5UWE8_9CLOT|nr:ribonuclease H family protein [Clostridium grantii]SHH67240.1 ribonuclease HI [Clostridium grantii DSM 8605]